jgi:ATP-dependent RNA helicase DeaD
VLGRVRRGGLRFLVATDIAARGIDLPELSHVIQYEPPDDPEAYIHRAGRTGRAGGSGTAMTLVNILERSDLLRIAKRYEFAIEERPLPDDEKVQQVVSERIITLLESRLRERDNLLTERMRRFVPLAQQLGQEEDGKNLLAMLLDDFYQETFYAHDVPVVPEEREKPAPRPRGSETRSGKAPGRRSGQSRDRRRRG